MADKKISELVDGGAPQATDEFVIDRAGADNFKVDWASMKTAAEANAVLDGDAAGGDLAGTYPNPTLAAIGAATGPVGDGTHVAAVTIDAKGRVTGLTSTAITGAAPTGAAGGDLSGTYPNPALSVAKQAELDGKVAKATYDANTILKADSDDTPVALPVGASTFVGRKAAGSISAMSVAEASTLLGNPYVPGGTDVPVTDGGTGASTAAAARTNLDVPSNAEAVLKTLYDANTVLAADTDNTPAALTMGASTILARLAAGNIKAASVAEIVALLQAYTVGGTDVALADGGTGASLTDPNADRIMFWDDSAGAVTWLTPGTNLAITGTTIDATGGAPKKYFNKPAAAITRASTSIGAFSTAWQLTGVVVASGQNVQLSVSAGVQRSANDRDALIVILRGSTQIASRIWAGNSVFLAGNIPFTLDWVDENPGAGTYTYEVQAAMFGGGTLTVHQSNITTDTNGGSSIFMAEVYTP